MRAPRFAGLLALCAACGSPEPSVDAETRMGTAHAALSWSPAINMVHQHAGHTMTLLSDNQHVLIVSLDGAETFDRVTQTFSPLSFPLDALRTKHTATLIQESGNYRVLITGGIANSDCSGPPYCSQTICLIDEQSIINNTVASCNLIPMSVPRIDHTATVVGGDVVLIGGHEDPAATVERYIPGTGLMPDVPDTPRAGHTATALTTVEILIVGGHGAECGFPPPTLYDPVDFSDPPFPSFDIPEQIAHTAATLPNGRPLIAGGWNTTVDCTQNPLNPLQAAHVYASTGWSPVQLSQPRTLHAMVSMSDGSVLVLGGQSTNQLDLGTTELFVPDPTTTTTGIWVPYAPLGVGLLSPEALRLPDGDVLVTGGYSSGGKSNKAYVLEASANGELCTLGAECETGFCVDGRCCDSACTAACQGCSAQTKGTGTDGSCGLVAANLPDPRLGCVDEGAPSCGHDGLCDGSGSCQSYPPQTPCTSPICEGGERTVGLCDPNGACVATVQSCEPYVCASTTDCGASCLDHGDCHADSYCDANQCILKRADGESCSDGAVCLSGHCSDGLCCNTLCDATCEACDVGGNEGVCMPVTGMPHAGHRACDPGVVGEPCSAHRCDGVNRTECSAFVSADVECAPARCDGEVAVAAALCDGTGHCGEPDTEVCAPSACRDGSCVARCTSDADCAATAACLAGICVDAGSCDGDHVAVAPDGERRDCYPLRCEAGACLERCSDSEQCVAPLYCNPEQQCVPAPPAGSGDGCACRAAPPPASARVAWLLLALLPTFRRRRALSYHRWSARWAPQASAPTASSTVATVSCVHCSAAAWAWFRRRRISSRGAAWRSSSCH